MADMDFTPAGEFSAFSNLKYGRGNKPAAFIQTESSALNVLCALEAHVPAMTDFERDPMEVIETGDTVFVNADEGYIEITKK